MRFRRTSNPLLLRTGLAFLALGTVIQAFALRSTWLRSLGADAVDRLHGLFLGLAIGLLFMALRTGGKGKASVCSREPRP